MKAIFRFAAISGAAENKCTGYVPVPAVVRECFL